MDEKNKQKFQVGDERTVETRLAGRGIEIGEVSRAADDEKILQLSISSDTALPDFPGELLILDHSPAAVRMERIQSAGVGRDRHGGPQVCMVERAWLEGPKLRVAVRFNSDENSAAMERDAFAGLLKNVSVDASIYRQILEEIKEDGTEVWRAIDWEPLGFAFEPYPQDISVGVSRSADNDGNETGESSIPNIQRKKDVEMENEKDNGNLSLADLQREITEQVTSQLKTEMDVLKRTKANTTTMLELGQKHDCMDLAREAIASDMSMDEFQGKIIERVSKAAAPVGKQSVDADRVGISREEAQRFDLMRACRMAYSGKDLDGFEGEMSKEVARKIGRDPEAHGFFLPAEVSELERTVQREMAMRQVSRTMSAGNFSQGGALVPDVQMNMIELLRNMAVVFRLGARRLEGLQGDIVFPRQTSASTVDPKSETGTTTSGNLGTDNLKGTPHRLTGKVPITRQLMAQSSEDVEALVREDLMIQLALKLDYLSLFGSGASGEVMGIANTSGVGSVTFGAAATRNKIIDFETELNTENALMGEIAYCTSPKAAGALRKVKVDAGSGKFLWEGSVLDGILDVYRAISSNQIPASGTYASRLFLADWRQLLVLFWAGTEIIVDPYSNKEEGIVDIQIERMWDTVIRHPESFVVSSDSAAQS